MGSFLQEETFIQLPIRKGYVNKEIEGKMEPYSFVVSLHKKIAFIGLKLKK
jgi:hypothetical protein